jgi:aldose 1-epimerase
MNKTFGSMPDGRGIDLYTLTNQNGLEAAVTNYGAILVSLKVPDRSGKISDVVLGYDSLDQYRADRRYFGGTIGRHANRIAKGAFVLDCVAYSLPRNRGENHLHGGAKGFDKVVWEASEVTTNTAQSVRLEYFSPDGEECYPGALAVRVTYTLTNTDSLEIEYEATTDKATIVNLTNHSYFNLSGEGNGDIQGHRLTLFADHFTPVDETLIPTGDLRAVAGTAFDFTRGAIVGARIDSDDEQLRYGHGYDHNWVVRGGVTDVARPAAILHDPLTGRRLDIWTTQPGMQFYSGNHLDNTITGKGGKHYDRRYGLCLEPQHFPNSPNEPRFPSTVLRPGEGFRSQTIYSFSVE